MGNCRSHGKSKIGHPTREAALLHAEEHQKAQTHLIGVYRCIKCQLWHIGRKPALRAYKQEKRRSDKRDEYLVGKLIGILRGTS